MIVRLKTHFAGIFENTGEITLGFGRSLVMYQPDNPCGDIEVRARTLEGFSLMDDYRENKDRWCVGISELDIDHHCADVDLTRIVSWIKVFNSKSEAAQKVAIEGLDVGFMPLQRLLIRMSGEKSPLVVVPR